MSVTAGPEDVLTDVPEQAVLPVHLTRFVGRTTELREVARMLSGTRLLTLTGAGGSGKTRLAREAAAVVSGDFARVGWIDLAPVTDAAMIPPQIAAALYLPDRGGSTAAESLITSIGDEHYLLVLDNCEHLIDACAAVVERLLRGCPRLVILATSREALGVPSETAWLVPPLAGSEAVQLFVERAQAALPSFIATDANVAALDEICRRLDGIPLAIELAAARVRVLSAEQIAGRLNDVFRLLTTGSRTALPRHRTLRGTMDWSYGLLDAREQQLLRRLAVFAGTFSLDAAEAVCVGGLLEVEDILDGVAALVDKSLVVMDAAEGEARYRLLETVKQYGLELLTESGELAELRARHGEYFLNVVEAAEPQLMGGEKEGGLLARVRDDHDNVRAAAAWALNEPGRAAEALRFAGAMMWFRYGMGSRIGLGQFRQARQYIDGALANAADVDPLVRARALLASGITGLAQGDNEHASAALAESLSIIRVHGTAALRAYVLAKLGGTRVMLGNLALAMDALDEAFALAQKSPTQLVHSLVPYWRGRALLAQGDRARAKAMFELGIDLGRQLSHRTIYAHCISQMGRLLTLDGDHADAFMHISEAIRMHLELGDAWGVAGDFDAVASLTMARGRVADSVRLMGAVDAIRERVAIGMPATEVAERQRLMSLARSRLGASFESLYNAGRALSMDDAVQLANDAGGMQTAEYRVPIFVHAQTPAIVEPADESPRGPPVPVAPAEPVAPQATLRVLGLGPLQVFVGDAPVESSAWGSARPRELLVYLLMHPEGRTKEQVGLAFWPEASTAQLRNSFHVTLHRLRKALRHHDWITSTNDRYHVDPSILRDFDVTAFERDVVAARRALKRKEEGAAAALERALDLYRGDFLDGEPAGDWHVEHRDRLQRMFADALMELGAQLTAEERHAKAADVYRRVLARDDLNEDAALALMSAHASLGERAQALRFYQRFAERMQRELEAEPSEELIELYEELKEGSVSH